MGRYPPFLPEDAALAQLDLRIDEFIARRMLPPLYSYQSIRNEFILWCLAGGDTECDGDAADDTSEAPEHEGDVEGDDPNEADVEGDDSPSNG